MEPIESFEHNGYVVKIYPDEDGESPRAWDNLGTMVCWHHRYNLGDRKPTDSERAALKRGGFRLLKRYLRRYFGVRHLLELGLLDHSGLHMWVGGGAHWTDTAGWDSGTVGWIMATKEGIDRVGSLDQEIEVEVELGFLRGKVKERRNAIEHGLHSEVEVYDQYLTGQVYGYVVEDQDGEHVDSCWGFYGIDDVKAEAKQAASCLEK